LCWCKAFYHCKFRIFAQNKMQWIGQLWCRSLRIIAERKCRKVQKKCFPIFSVCILPDIMPILFRCASRRWWYCFLSAMADLKP